MGGHSMLRSGCGCLVSLVLIVIALIVGLLVMNATPPAGQHPRPGATPTPVAGVPFGVASASGDTPLRVTAAWAGG
jgi:hypothetical protein